MWIGDVLIRAAAEGTDTYELNRNLRAHRRRPRRLGAEPGDRDRRDRRRRPRQRDRTLRRRAAVLPAGPRHPRGRGAPARRARLLRRASSSRIGVPEVEERLLAAIERRARARWASPASSTPRTGERRPTSDRLRAGLRGSAERARRRRRPAASSGRRRRPSPSCATSDGDRPRRRRHLHARRRLAVRGRGRRLHHRVLAARLAVRPAHRRAPRPCPRPARPGLPRHASTATTCSSTSPPPSTRRHAQAHAEGELTVMATLEIRDLHVSVETEQRRQGDPARRRPDRPLRRDPRDHGPERLGQVDAGLLDRRSPEVHGHRRHRHPRRRRTSSR